MLKMSLRETKNNKMYITTTSCMPFAEYEICTFNLKMYVGVAVYSHSMYIVHLQTYNVYTSIL